MTVLLKITYRNITNNNSLTGDCSSTATQATWQGNCKIAGYLNLPKSASATIEAERAIFL